MTRRTTIYLPDELKKAVEQEAARRGESEAEVIRRAIGDAVRRPRPRPGIFRGDPIAEHADEFLDGFGER
ncbi:MAG: ribbon-helix-helix protein, CopG family [Acidimicrobiia bacterium]|nr:ribbon-helix-helix protein, CopG family [Acidimicrobiia bacterium]